MVARRPRTFLREESGGVYPVSDHYEPISEMVLRQSRVSIEAYCDNRVRKPQSYYSIDQPPNFSAQAGLMCIVIDHNGAGNYGGSA